MKNYKVSIFTDTIELYEYLVDDAFDTNDAMRRAVRNFRFSGSGDNKEIREVRVTVRCQRKRGKHYDRHKGFGFRHGWYNR